ncbi:MAG: hypothetical protein NUV65_04960 [Candidatus Roizmanbacteria bacterium]|nr:hypothetical protein [Candidatus Roizmanbacteria bacterium]
MDDSHIQNDQDGTVEVKPEIPKRNIWMIVAVVLFTLLIGVSVYARNVTIRQKAVLSTPTPNNTLPTITPIQQIVSNPSNAMTDAPKPTASKVIAQSITLKVAAIGGGASGERYDYTFTFAADPQDTSTILKRDINEIRNFPAYNQGAFDKGLTIKHGATELEIMPSFEGAGSSTLKKINPVIITNTALSDSPIYRINTSDIVVPSGFANNLRIGAKYTLSYKNKPEDCTEWSESTPACTYAQGVTLRDGNDLSIYCTAEDESALWCDTIVKNLNVTVSKYSN